LVPAGIIEAGVPLLDRLLVEALFLIEDVAAQAIVLLLSNVLRSPGA